MILLYRTCELMDILLLLMISTFIYVHTKWSTDIKIFSPSLNFVFDHATCPYKLYPHHSAWVHVNYRPSPCFINILDMNIVIFVSDMETHVNVSHCKVDRICCWGRSPTPNFNEAKSKWPRLWKTSFDFDRLWVCKIYGFSFFIYQNFDLVI